MVISTERLNISFTDTLYITFSWLLKSDQHNVAQAPDSPL